MNDFIIEKGILKEYNGTGGDVVIPDGVTHIKEKVFSGYRTLRSIVMPESVIDIGNFAFQDCTGLQTLIIPKNVTKIRDGVFRYCANIHTVVLPSRLTDIGREAFCCCENLQGILLPESLQTIGDAAFQYCSNLKSIHVPNGTVSIGNRAFEHCISLKNFEIPKNIKRIGESTFHGCGNLQSISLPDGLTYIGNSAFFDCTKLTNILIQDSVTHIEDQAFRGCRALASDGKTLILGNILFNWFGKETEISIPENVTRISSYAFEYQKKLQHLTVTNGVTEIGDWAFRYCSELQTVTIPKSVVKIGACAFPEDAEYHQCTLVPDSEDEQQSKMILNAIGIQNLTRPFLSDALKTNAIIWKKLKNHVTSRKFRQESIPLLIEQNEPSMLAKLLSHIKRISVEEIDGYIEQSERSPEIRTVLMEFKNRIYPAEILEKIERIQTEKDLGLREKTLTDYRKDFKIFKDGDFYKITGYKSENETVWIPAQIHEIPVCIAKKAFADCEKISYVHIENGITAIEDHAFRNCQNLQEITVPESISRIGFGAFTDCENLRTIHYDGTRFQWESVKKDDILSQGFCSATVICADGEISYFF